MFHVEKKQLEISVLERIRDMFLKPVEERTVAENAYTMYGICYAAVCLNGRLSVVRRPANSVSRFTIGERSVYYWPIREQPEIPNLVPWERKYDLMRAAHCTTMIAELQQQIKDHATANEAPDNTN